MSIAVTHPAIPVYLNRVSEDPLSRMSLSYNYAGPIEYLKQLPENEFYIVLDPRFLNLQKDEDIEFDIWLEGLHGLEAKWHNENAISGCKMSLNSMTDQLGLYIYPPLLEEQFKRRFELPAPGFFVIPT